ncbi:MAG: glycoside-pentoside-hexuronide (GPH):cation symporter [Faecalimonas sp.]|nr:glycoside-pentoside-hexuronide (GPH):cation symporter [Faecalimonas sp.]
MNTKKEIRPFGWRDKLGYLFGDFGNDFTFIFASLFLMVFYTKVLGISAELVGVMFVIVRLLDAVTDVTMGRVVDKMKPGKNGRFRPWIRWMCGPVALASFLMYQSGLAGASMTVKIIYMYVTYVLWGSLCYTAINIPYGSMASVISEDTDDRATLSTFRSLGAAFASLVIGVLAPLLVYTKDANGNQIVEGGRMTIVAGIFSAAAIGCYLLCYTLTTERVQILPQKGGEKMSLGSTLKRLISDRALLGIILAAVLLLLASLLTQSINQYVFLDYFNDNTGISIMSAAGIVPSLVIAPFVLPITRGIGKKEASVIGCVLAGISSILLYFLHVRNMWVFIIISILGYAGFSFFNLVIWSIITDVIDDQEVKTGKREDGTIYALYSFARKFGQAAAGGLGGFALAMTGYNESVQVQTQEVADGIYNVATLYPGILYIGVGLVLLFIYPLGKKKVSQNAAVLKERRQKGTAD